MPPRGPDLRFNEVEIVEQPLGGGSDALAAFGRVIDQFISGEQGGLVLGQPREQPVGTTARIHLVRPRQGDGMLVELIRAEQFRSQRLFRAQFPVMASKRAEKLAADQVDGSALDRHSQRMRPPICRKTSRQLLNDGRKEKATFVALSDSPCILDQ